MNTTTLQRALRAGLPTALAVAAVLAPVRSAHAEGASQTSARPQVLPSTPKPYAYGIFVGHNQGGPGQAKLRYAEGDAKLAADTLRDLGRYGTADMRVLTAPSPSEVLTAIDVVSARLKEHQQRGEQAVLIFYFSGHAKANALDLADKELDLGVLRDRLRSAPSTLTLVVLDACQSGAFSRTKGVEAAKSFSTNSVARLMTKGMAVMASSTSQELSQESDELRSSFFTHHFLVGLRGAGDLDHDGKVTLDEAYRYAYRSTLAATERTAVGGQHVTLETDLSGQGEVPLAFPREAKSRLELPAGLDGRVVLQHKASGSIVAEIQKASGAPTQIALPAGDYDAIVRQGSRVRSCGLTLVDDHVTSFEKATCVAQADTSRSKGEGEETATDASPVAAAAAPPPAPDADRSRSSIPLSIDHGELGNWALELGFGLTSSSNDAYFDRLRTFGFEQSDSSSWRLSAMLTRNFGRYFALGIEAHTLPSFEFTRGSTDKVEGSAWAGGGLARLVLPFIPEGKKGWFEAYVQGSVAAAHSTLTVQAAENQEDTKWAPSFGGAGGIAGGGRIGGGFLTVGYDHASAISNRLGDEHNVGGPYVLIGARLRTY